MVVNWCACVLSHLVVSDSLWLHGPARPLCLWDFPGKNTGMDCHFLPQGIFLSQGSNPSLLNCRRILYYWVTRKDIYVQFICSDVSDSLRIHGLQSTRLSCPSPTPELAQIHVHQVGDAIQPSLPLLFPSPPAFNLSQLQGLFQWVSSSHQMARLLEFQLQHQSFQWIFRTDLL